MTRYANGHIPREVLILTASGVNSEGYWEHLWPASTLRKWQALVADVLANEGVLLRITSGWNVYRPIEPQRVAKRLFGRNAAEPGHSSHGGTFAGRDSMAAQFQQSPAIGREKFYAYCRKHGLVPNVFDWEPWHWVDFDPWAAVPANTEPTEIPKEWDEMATKEEIQAAVRDVVRDVVRDELPDAVKDPTRLREAVIISYASTTHRNGVVLAAAGFWHKFTSEEWTQFRAHGLNRNIRTRTAVNDRDWDVLHDIYTRDDRRG